MKKTYVLLFSAYSYKYKIIVYKN